MNADDRVEAVPAAVEAGPAAGAGRIDEIFKRHHGMVFRAARRVTGNAADAEDVLQTVFLRLVRRQRTTGEVVELESYLYRAAVNAGLDLLRARRRKPMRALDEAAQGESSGGADSPERIYEGGEIRGWLRRAVARLSPMSGEIVVLRFFEGQTNDEIARILDTTPGTVAVLLHRARTRLEREYREHWGGAT